MKNKICLSISILASLFLTACNSVQDVRSEYKIGIIAPLSGVGSIYGESYIKGAELALEESDKNINLIKQDSKFEGKASLDAANFLINVKNVDILNSLFHLPSQTVSSISKEKKTPLIYEAYTRSILDDNPYAFKAHFDAIVGCEKLMKIAKEKSFYQKVGILMAQTEYNQLCLDGLKKIEPNIQEYWYPFSNTDFKTLLTKMNSDGIDTLVTIMIDFEYAALFKQLTELGYPIKVMCATASECIYPQIEADMPASVLNGTLAIDFIPPTIRKSEMAKKYLSKHPEASFVELNYAVSGYEMIKYTSKAFDRCEPKEKKCLKQALENIKDYDSVLKSPGFKDRVLQVENKVYTYLDGIWQNIE